ncbi:hypothetical protein Tsubulata_019211 [Turnera subulata]|uniref:Uncharacterized protein n=1 Tax=Turnera subulata TaxID=218843 RepID=A0A9Q0F3X6_9ROSI|nr:hypothetical protein Tsubulata_019211 [Turnera subulata]
MANSSKNIITFLLSALSVLSSLGVANAKEIAVEGKKKTWSHDAVTDDKGMYHIKVTGNHDEDICEVMLVESNDPDCNEVNKDQYLKKTARVEISSDDGEVEKVREVSPLGFMIKEPMAQCVDVMRDMGIAADGSIA